MEEAAAVRRAVVEAVHDVVPADLRDGITTFVEDGSALPGVLTLLVADRLGGGVTDYDAVDGLVERGVGVQLIYDGLRLTRDLVHEDPWAGGRKAEADMNILAADVMVARGFYLLARTEAATAAVEVVRAFGRDQTNRREAGATDPDRELERDVVELALVAGATAVEASPPDADGFVGRVLAAGTEPGTDSVSGSGFPASETLSAAQLLDGLGEGSHDPNERAVRND